LFEVRDKTLNVAESQLGRLAVAITTAVNAQQRRGADQTGVGGKDFFVDQADLGSPVASLSNNPNSTTQISGRLTDPVAAHRS
jgi:hypothetical protein